MRVTIKQLKSLISEAVRTAHVPSVKNHKSELARLKKIIKEGVEDAVNGKEEEKVDPITREAAALSPEEAKIELEELLRDAPPELLQKLQDMVADPEFRAIKAKLNEGSDYRHREQAKGLALMGATTGSSLALLVAYTTTVGLFFVPGMSAAAVLALTGLLAAATIGSIAGVIKHVKQIKPSTPPRREFDAVAPLRDDL